MKSLEVCVEEICGSKDSMDFTVNLECLRSLEMLKKRQSRTRSLFLRLDNNGCSKIKHKTPKFA